MSEPTRAEQLGEALYPFVAESGEVILLIVLRACESGYVEVTTARSADTPAIVRALADICRQQADKLDEIARHRGALS